MSALPDRNLLELLAARIISADRSGRVLPYYISGFLDAILMGLSLSQMVQYRRFFRTDRRHIVALVFASFTLTVVASVILIVWMCYLFVWNFGLYLPMTEVKWLARYMTVDVVKIFFVQASLGKDAVPKAPLTSTQTFYVDRACRLWQHWWPAALMGPFVFATMCIGAVALGFLNTRYDYMTPDVLENPLLKSLVYSLLGSVIFTDLLITAVITYGLHRVKSGWEHTDSVLRMLIIRSFEAQAFALLSSVIVLIAWNRQFEIAIAWVLIQTKIYVLGVQITLNLRAGPSESALQARKSSGLMSATTRMESSTYVMDYLFSVSFGAVRGSRSESKEEWMPIPGQNEVPHLNHDLPGAASVYR